MSEQEIEANATTDSDNPLWTDAELSTADLVMPGDGPKVPVSIRLDPEVLDHFKKSGRGYQSRISAVLLAYVRSRTRKQNTG
ncbi:MAG TPA: BrnA antitoxin family protein [Longimicrobiaceae bacterium]|nr:BrnA antitoxin family protein [Longimicrobiaceae bacterium]